MLRRFAAMLFLFLLGMGGVVAPQAQRPVRAQALSAFVLGWNPFDEKINIDEPTPKGTITQRACKVDVWVWDRPMPSYPDVALFGEPIRIGVTFATPQSKGVSAAWWSADPRLKSREKYLKAKSFKDLPKDIVWHSITDIVGGQWSFDYLPTATSVNSVRVVAFIEEGKETTRRPFPFVRIGDYDGILRGAEVRFVGKDPHVPGTNDLEPCFLGRDGKLNAKRVCRAFFEEGFGGQALLFNYRNEPGPDDVVADQGNQVVPPATDSEPGNVGSEETSNRWAVPVTKGLKEGASPLWACIKWPNGTNSAAQLADGKNRFAIPSGVTKFKVYIGIKQANGELDWKENVPFDEKGQQLPYYPTPDEKTGGTITFPIGRLDARK